VKTFRTMLAGIAEVKAGLTRPCNLPPQEAQYSKLRASERSQHRFFCELKVIQVQRVFCVERGIAAYSCHNRRMLAAARRYMGLRRYKPNVQQIGLTASAKRGIEQSTRSRWYW
jgi:hypothetical protein